MKTAFSAFILAGTLLAHTGACAQGSTLRVACKGNNVGATVTIDGQFKGECPLEAQVRAGTLKLRLVKKVDSLHERVFEQDIRLGDGVVKQIDAVLSAPRLIAGGQGGGNAAPAAASAKSGTGAKAGSAAYQGLVPSRPRIPVAVSEDIWKIIEASDSYRNLPKPRTVKVVFQGKKEMEYTGSKSRSLPKPGAESIRNTSVTAPVGDKCTTTLTEFTTEGKPEARFEYRSYQCGYIYLGSTSGVKTQGFVSSIDELKGSLFPMRVGARQTIRYQMAFAADRKYDSKHAADCAVVSRLAAHELDPRLAGAAWKMHCRSSYSSNSTNIERETESDDYYLEDLGVMLSSIGAYDSSKEAHLLPSAGTQTLVAAEGDYGSRTTTTYASYNWEVGGVYEMPAQVAAIAASTNDGRSAAARDEPAQREQPQPAAAEQAKLSNLQNARTAQAEEPASGSSDFLGAMLGGLASSYVDRTATQINSAAAGTGGAGGVAMGVLGSVTTQLARETREQVARDMGGNGGFEGAAGALVGNALGSGSTAGAIAAFSGATDNLSGSGSAGSGTSAPGSGKAAGGACCSSASERMADNRARGAPENFETNNERICRQTGQRAYCEAGVTERRLKLGGLEKFGAPGRPAKGPNEEQLKVARACGEPAKLAKFGYRSTNNPQVDNGCQIVAFNLCLNKEAGVDDYNQSTKAQCLVLRETAKSMGGTVCEEPCRAARLLPVM